jgi:hypothetical protein
MGEYGRVRVRREIVEAVPERCDRGWVGLEDVLRSTAAGLRGQAARKRLALRMSMPPDLPLVGGGAEQLLRFFAAVFSAAIDNTPDGGRVCLDIQRGENCAIILSIAGGENDVSREEIRAAARLFAGLGSVEIDGATSPETIVTLHWCKERWRVDRRELAVAPGFW